MIPIYRYVLRAPAHTPWRPHHLRSSLDRGVRPQGPSARLWAVRVRPGCREVHGGHRDPASPRRGGCGYRYSRVRGASRCHALRGGRSVVFDGLGMCMYAAHRTTRARSSRSFLARWRASIARLLRTDGTRTTTSTPSIWQPPAGAPATLRGCPLCCAVLCCVCSDVHTLTPACAAPLVVRPGLLCSTSPATPSPSMLAARPPRLPRSTCH